MSFEEKRDVSIEVVVLDTIFDLPFVIDMILTFFIPDINGEGKVKMLDTFRWIYIQQKSGC